MLNKNLFQSKGFQRFLILALLAIILFAFRSMINLILFIFIFTFLMDSLVKLFTRQLNKYIKVSRMVVVTVLYTTIVSAMFLVIYKYLPVVAVQISQIVTQLTEFYQEPHDNVILTYIADTLKSIDISTYLKEGLDVLYAYAANIGKIGFEVFLALLLSLFFLLEKERIQKFTSQFRDSKIGPVYAEMEYFGSRFSKSFGKVIEAQFLIAVVNGLLSIVGLWILGFPQLLGLGLMIFLLGLIPVAGVIISLIPLCTIAFTIGGIAKVIYVLIFIMLIHALESYVLNPKLMSAKTNLPVFYTFIILIFSEHFFGVWGLIIGIPMFMFFLDVLDVTKDDK